MPRKYKPFVPSLVPTITSVWTCCGKAMTFNECLEHRRKSDYKCKIKRVDKDVSPGR